LRLTGFHNRLRTDWAAAAIPHESAFNILLQNCAERQLFYERHSTFQSRACMPRRNLLSSEQRIRLFAIPTDPAEMARHYVLSSDDLAVIRTKRRPINRLGFAIQLCLLRHPGQGMGPGEGLVQNWGCPCAPDIFAPVLGPGVGRGVDFEVGGSRGRGSLRGHHGDQQAR
jgi:hypothetical protein